MRKRTINNLEDIRYHKLLVKTEIRLKEDKIKRNWKRLNNEFQRIDFKNDILSGIMNNPAIAINTARITYDLVTRFRRWRRNRKNRLQDQD